MREPDRLQRRLALDHGLGVLRPANIERKAHILERRQRREEVVGLEHEADMAAPPLSKLLGIKPIQGLSADTHCAGGRREDAAEDRQQRCLAAARGPHQQCELARVQRQAHALQGAHLAGTLAELLDDIRRL